MAAGQTAVFLSQTAKHVHVLIRSGRLADTMSNYLIRRIEESKAVTSTGRPKWWAWRAPTGWITC